MKHIKSRKVFELLNYDNETIQTLKDICVELEDGGFSIKFSGNDNDPSSVYLAIQKRSPTNLMDYKFGEVMDVLIRISDYLGKNLNKILYISTGAAGYNSISSISLDNLVDIMTYNILIDFKCDGNEYINIGVKMVSESISNDDLSEYINDVFEGLKDSGFNIGVHFGHDLKYQNRPMKRDELSAVYKITIPRVGSFPERGSEYFRLNDVIPSLQHALSYLSEKKNSRITNVSEIEFVSFHTKDESDMISNWVIIDTGDISSKLDKYSNTLADIVYLKFRLFI